MRTEFHLPVLAAGEWSRATYGVGYDGSWAFTLDGATWSETTRPTEDERNEAWNRYYDYVIETGTDPLDEFIGVPRYRKFPDQEYVATFRKIRGVMNLVSVRMKYNKPVPADAFEYFEKYEGEVWHGPGLTKEIRATLNCRKPLSKKIRAELLRREARKWRKPDRFNVGARLRNKYPSRSRTYREVAQIVKPKLRRTHNEER